MDARRALQRILDKNERITPHERGDFGRYNAMRCDAAPARSASLSVTKRRKDRLKLSRGGENLKERLLSPSLSPAFVLPKRLDFMAARAGLFPSDGVAVGGRRQRRSLSLNLCRDQVCCLVNLTVSPSSRRDHEMCVLNRSSVWSSPKRNISMMPSIWERVGR